jgi:general secretion pathway protein A
MYHRYFGLQEAPFSISVNPRYLFMSARHRDALAHLLYGVGVGGGFILLTGEVGTGKTTINRCVLEQLPENTDIALVLNPALDAIELLATVCDELGIENAQGEQSLKDLTDKLHQFLLSNYSNDRNTVLLIDEAQHLSFDVLEQIRLLTNLETNTKKLLQIILVGQPELRTLLAKPELRQLAQRITARYQLKPLNLQETHAYIRHRLHIAGLPANQELFPSKVVKRLHKTSRGIPRLINILCDRMLLGTYGQNKTVVDISILQQATEEVLGEEEELRSIPTLHHAYTLVAAGFAAVLVVAIGWWQYADQSEPAVELTPVSVASDTTNDTTSGTASVPQQQPDIPTTTERSLPPTPVDDSPLFIDQRSALSELLGVQDISVKAPNDLCSDKTVQIVSAEASAPIFLCELQTVDTWQDFQTYNRPAVLTLVTTSRKRLYATLIAIDNNEAVLSHDNGLQSKMSLDQLGQIWTGEFLFIWQAAPHFTRPIGFNDSGPMVKWLAGQFAQIDEQDTPLANDTFNLALKQRVKMFQDEYNLESDGLVGLKTLLKINEVLGISKTLAVQSESSLIDSPPSKTELETQAFSQSREG